MSSTKQKTPEKVSNLQDQDRVGKLLGSLVGQKVTVKQTNDKELVGKLIEGNSEYLRLQQGTGETKKYIYIFREGLSELSTVETS